MSLKKLAGAALLCIPVGFILLAAYGEGKLPAVLTGIVLVGATWLGLTLLEDA